jgi:hypothetical protein
LPGFTAIDREDREIKKNRAYAVRTEWGCTIKFLQREGDILMMIPTNPDREVYPIQILNLNALTYDLVVGHLIWNWQSL